MQSHFKETAGTLAEEEEERSRWLPSFPIPRTPVVVGGDVQGGLGMLLAVMVGRVKEESKGFSVGEVSVDESDSLQVQLCTLFFKTFQYYL